MEKTLVILKPDAVRRKLVGNIISRFENKNFNIADMKLVVLSNDIIKEHYAHIKNIPAYPEIVEFMTSGPVVVMVLEGENVIKFVRNMIGKTNILEATPGTIRGDFGTSLTENIIHASDSPENAEIEIRRFFS